MYMNVMKVIITRKTISVLQVGSRAPASGRKLVGNRATNLAEVSVCKPIGT